MKKILAGILAAILLMADAACIPLGYDTDCYLQSSRITGAWHSPCGLCYLMFADIEE